MEACADFLRGTWRRAFQASGRFFGDWECVIVVLKSLYVFVFGATECVSASSVGFGATEC